MADITTDKHFFKYYLLTLVVLTGCISELDIDSRGIDHSIVVNSYFSPDDTVFVYVTETADIFENSISTLENVDLSITDGADTFKLQSHALGGFYLEPGKLLVNTQYQLLGLSPSGQPFGSTSSIPKAARIPDVQQIFPAGFDEYGDPFTEYSISIEDIKGEDNYYELFIISISPNGADGIHLNEFANFLDPIIEAEGLEGFENNSFLFSDQLFEDSIAEIKIRFINASSGAELPLLPSKDIRGLHVVLLTVSEEYYNFRRSWVVHKFHQQNNPDLSSGSDLTDLSKFLFKGDVQELETNIEGGLGVFAGYNVTLYKIDR
ncbi:MAG: DUF4249 domain-containing protein [Cyclobacteriaceae bacterium]